MGQPALARILKRHSIPLCSYYLLYIHRGTRRGAPCAANPPTATARDSIVFNWMGDISEAGLRRLHQACGELPVLAQGTAAQPGVVRGARDHRRVAPRGTLGHARLGVIGANRSSTTASLE